MNHVLAPASGVNTCSVLADIVEIVLACMNSLISYKYSKQSPSTLGETSEKKKPQEVKDRDRRLLVFDYMANGCLYDHIHEERESLSGSSRVHPLSPLVSSWHMRLRIAGLLET